MTGSGIDHYAESLILQGLLRGVPITPPATVYVGLLTGDTSEDNPYAAYEVSATSFPAMPGYARQAITFGAVTVADGTTGYPTGSFCANSSTASFYLPDGPNGPAGEIAIAGFGLFDAASGGNMLFHGPLSYGYYTDSTATTITLRPGDVTVYLD